VLTAYGLLVLLAGILIMGYESVQTRYSLPEIAPASCSGSWPKTGSTSGSSPVRHLHRATQDQPAAGGQPDQLVEGPFPTAEAHQHEQVHGRVDALAQYGSITTTVPVRVPRPARNGTRFCMHGPRVLCPAVAAAVIVIVTGSLNTCQVRARACAGWSDGGVSLVE
jgi:hypothetical protein